MVKDYPQMSVRLPPEVKAKLEALSLVRAQPQWRVISAAIVCYVRELSVAERRLVASIVAKAARSER
jgi:predicted transcriptional regulator